MGEAFPRITQEALERLRARIGRPVPRPQPHITEATPDAIRHWALGIGDANPLWLDADYARRTRWGVRLAPPTILYAFDRVVGGYVGGLPGVHAMYAGADFHFVRPIVEGDRLVGESVLKDVVLKETRFAGRAVLQVYTTTFRDARGEVVAVADSWCFRTERDTARQRRKYRDVEAQIPHRYTPEELEAIWRDYEREERRGARPRYWEEVQVGEALPPVVKGPWRVTDAIAFLQGWGGLYIASHGLAFLDLYRRHPALAIPNAYGVPEPPERVHWDGEFAQRVGGVTAYDYGPERVSWMGHLVTNWMGDDGVLKRLMVRLLRHNFLGDTTWCRGRVRAKRMEGGEALVELDLEAVNQRGERTAEGLAVVRLPTKAEAPPPGVTPP